jgi:hypothetical protein
VIESTTAYIYTLHPNDNDYEIIHYHVAKINNSYKGHLTYFYQIPEITEICPDDNSNNCNAVILPGLKVNLDNMGNNFGILSGEQCGYYFSPIFPAPFIINVRTRITNYCFYSMTITQNCAHDRKILKYSDALKYCKTNPFCKVILRYDHINQNFRYYHLAQQHQPYKCGDGDVDVWTSNEILQSWTL